MAADAPTGRYESLENGSESATCGGFYFCGELVYQRLERHYMARQEISLEQIARILAFHLGAEKIRGTLRAGDEHRRGKDAQEVLAKRLAPSLSAPNEC